MTATPKRYKMTLATDDESRGVQLISLVGKPAIQSGWVALAAQAARPALRVSLAESGKMKQVVTGPVLIPDQDILRLDSEGNPFYITFDAATIEAAAARFLEQGRTKHASDSHAVDATGQSVLLSGPAVRESWIVTDAATDGRGFDVPAGTWMLSMHVPNADVWARIESGELTGFSLEGLFDMETALAAVAAPKPAPMTKSKPGWFAKMMAYFAVMASATLEDGSELEITSDGEVFTVADGTRGAALADGEYKLADGTALVVKGGMKAEAVAAAAETPAEETPPAADLAAENAALKAENDALKAKVAELEAAAGKMSETEAKLAEVELKLSVETAAKEAAQLKLSQTPSGTPVKLAGAPGSLAADAAPHQLFLAQVRSERAGK